MEETSTRSPEQDCVDVIDKLHEMAHAGAFRSMDAGLISKCTKILCSLFDVNVTMDDAARFFKKPKSYIYDTIYRKLTGKDKPKSIKVISYSVISRILGHK